MTRRTKIDLGAMSVKKQVTDSNSNGNSYGLLDSEAIKRVSLDLRESVHRRAKMLAVEKSITLAELLRGFVDEGLKKDV